MPFSSVAPHSLLQKGILDPLLQKGYEENAKKKHVQNLLSNVDFAQSPITANFSI